MSDSKRKPTLVAYRRRATPEAMAEVAGSIVTDLRGWWNYCLGIAAGALVVAAGSSLIGAILTAVVMFATVAAVSAWRYAWAYYRLGPRLRLWWALRRLG